MLEKFFKLSENGTDVKWIREQYLQQRRLHHWSVH